MALIDGEFVLCSERFQKDNFPNLYRMYQANQENAETQLQSIADAWHNGSINSAAIAFESDLAHG